jgi:hypothetical protein
MTGQVFVDTNVLLLTEDLQHGQMLGTVRVIDPFASPERTPAELLSAAEAK